MLLSELIDQLQEIADDLPEDVDPKVRLATQPSWPLAFNVRGLALQSDLSDYVDPDEVEYGDLDDEPEKEEIVWIVEGGHPSDSPYAPRGAWDAVR